MALRNPMKAYNQWRAAQAQKSGAGASNVVPFNGGGPPANAAPGGIMPITQNGTPPSPHEFLQAQIVNLPPEEESAQKRALLSVAYVLTTWGGSIIVILLGFGLAGDLQTVFHVEGMYATALSLLFAFAEFVFEMLAILVGERIHAGIQTRGDAAFVFVFGPFVILANTGTALLQMFLFQQHDAVAANQAQTVLLFRAYLPLFVSIATIGVVAGIQRRSLKRMVNAIHRKAAALTEVAQASVHFLEADMNARRAIDEHDESRARREQDARHLDEYHKMQRDAFDREQERLKRLQEDDGNGRRGRL